jgi:hypothetical protein
MKVYLCKLPWANYDITCIAKTEKKAMDSVYSQYKIAEKNNHSTPMPKKKAFEYYGGWVLCTELNEVHWL